MFPFCPIHQYSSTYLHSFLFTEVFVNLEDDFSLSLYLIDDSSITKSNHFLMVTHDRDCNLTIRISKIPELLRIFTHYINTGFVWYR